jgi:FAD/FMN-containing dehydrogenase
MADPISNYDGGITTSPAQRVYPQTVQELQDILRDTARFPGPVRAMGSYHSLTPCASADGGTVIHMSRMNRVAAIDRANMTFTAQAGLEFIDAAKALREQGLQFMTNIEIGNMTLGSAACCQTKDSLDGVQFGQVNSYVTGMKWVDPAGQLQQATDATDPDLMYRMRSSYGLVGVVYEVTFRIKPVEPVHFTYLPRPIRELTEREVDAIIAGAEGLVCWTIGETAHFQARNKADRVGAFGPLFARLRRWTWNKSQAQVGRLIERCFSNPSMRDFVLDRWFGLDKLVFFTLHHIGGATLYDPDKTINYRSTPPSAKYAFTFWTFPRAQWLSTMREYLEFAKRHRDKYGFRCNMALGSYFIRADTHSLLSYSHDGEVFSIDPIHAYSDKAAWDRFLQEFNEFATKRNGIPLLNQSPFIEKRHVEAAYGQRWQEFSRWVKTCDPAGRMLNPFFAALL